MAAGSTQAGGGQKGLPAPKDEGELVNRGDAGYLFEQGLMQFPEPLPPVVASDMGGKPRKVYMVDTGGQGSPDENLAPASEDNTNHVKIDKIPKNLLGWFVNIPDPPPPPDTHYYDSSYHGTTSDGGGGSSGGSPGGVASGVSGGQGGGSPSPSSAPSASEPAPSKAGDQNSSIVPPGADPGRSRLQHDGSGNLIRDANGAPVYQFWNPDTGTWVNEVGT